MFKYTLLSSFVKLSTSGVYSSYKKIMKAYKRRSGDDCEIGDEVDYSFTKSNYYKSDNIYSFDLLTVDEKY